MADAGIGEATVAEGAKSAGEAAGLSSGMDLAADAAVGGNSITGAGAALGSGAGALSGMDLAADAVPGAGNNVATAAANLTGTGLPSGMDLASDAATGGNSITGAGSGLGTGAPPTFGENINPNAPLGPQTAGAPASVSPTAPVGTAGDAGIPGSPDPSLASPQSAPAAPTGAPTSTPLPPTNASVTAPDLGAPSAPLQAGPTNPGMVQQALDTMKKNPFQAANVGLSGVALAKQLAGAGSAQKQFNNVAGPTQGVSNDLLAKFSSGQLSGADSFAIAQMTQKKKAQVDQYYAKAGLSNSSMHQQALQQIDTEAEGMRQQAVENLLKNGLQAAGVANPVLTQGITAGVNQDAASMKNMQDFIATLSKMNTQQTSQQTGTPGG